MFNGQSSQEIKRKKKENEMKRLFVTICRRNEKEWWKDISKFAQKNLFLAADKKPSNFVWKITRIDAHCIQIKFSLKVTVFFHMYNK